MAEAEFAQFVVVAEDGQGGDCEFVGCEVDVDETKSGEVVERGQAALVEGKELQVPQLLQPLPDQGGDFGEVDVADVESGDLCVVFAGLPDELIDLEQRLLFHEF